MENRNETSLKQNEVNSNLDNKPVQEDYKNKKKTFFSKITSFLPASLFGSSPSYIILFLLGIMPIFFLPLTVSGFQPSKMYLFYVLSLLALILWIVDRLKAEAIKIPQNLMTLSVVLIPVVYLVSAFFSPNVPLSLYGRDFAIDSGVAIVFMFGFLLLVSSIFQSAKKSFNAYSVLVISFIVVAILHISRFLFINSWPTLNFFVSATSNTVGKLNDLAVFSGVIVILSMITLEALKLRGKAKIVTYSSYFLGLLVVLMINFSMLWYVLGGLSLILFIYFITLRRGNFVGSSAIGQLPILPIIVIALAFFVSVSNPFSLSGNTFGESISRMFNVQMSEVRPSATGTLQIAKETLKTSPVFGVGPYRFDTEWLRSKTSSINETDFWNIDFHFGFGAVPTFIVTTGALGIATWIFFFVMFIMSGFRAIFRQASSALSKYLILSSFASSMMLWILSIVYIPSSVTWMLTFFFTGIFLASLYREDALKVKEISLSKDPKFGFMYVFASVLLIAGIIVSGYGVTKKYVANVFYQRAFVLLNRDSNIDAAELFVFRAATLSPNDIYSRSLSEINQIRINQILSSENPEDPTVAARFRNALSASIGNMQNAINYDKYNYQNYVSLAQIYEAVIPLGVEGAYDKSKETYTQAQMYNPKSPALELALARLEITKKNNQGAREHIAKSLELKTNYTDAIFLLSQIDVSEGNVNQAIKNVEDATIIRPNDPVVFFQLGLLQYSEKKYSLAVGSLERAVILSPTYSNAKYFLGLSYYNVDRNDDAIAQFEDLKILNPGNEEVELILSNLKEGKEPFDGAQLPVDNRPENRDEPPVKDGDKVDSADSSNNDVPEKNEEEVTEETQ